uniref:uncharacterized protein LOC120888004 n=1 Tax=Ictidomys tridecemlineatus TaxID=43179 RepID=UPI001A9F5302|nr:uncharacterized protein LOC120888004 [Ictidomys tridecemlineatus]
MDTEQETQDNDTCPGGQMLSCEEYPLKLGVLEHTVVWGSGTLSPSRGLHPQPRTPGIRMPRGTQGELSWTDFSPTEIGVPIAVQRPPSTGQMSSLIPNDVPAAQGPSESCPQVLASAGPPSGFSGVYRAAGGKPVLMLWAWLGYVKEKKESPEGFKTIGSVHPLFLSQPPRFGPARIFRSPLQEIQTSNSGVALWKPSPGRPPTAHRAT